MTAAPERGYEQDPTNEIPDGQADLDETAA
jgi:hypothetical protein